MNAPEFFARFFGFTYIPVEGNSEFYYFEQEVDANGTKNVIQIRKAKVDVFYRALGPAAGWPGPFITGVLGNTENGLPEHLLVVPTLGADVVVMYNREGLEGGQSG